jgi:hypothetical protein
MAHQREGQQRAEGSGHDGGDHADLQAGGHRVAHARHPAGVAPGVEGEPLPGEVEATRGVVEREQDDHRDRNEQVDQHEHADGHDGVPAHGREDPVHSSSLAPTRRT